MHNICLYRRVVDGHQFMHILTIRTIRVARLDPNDESEFCRQLDILLRYPHRWESNSAKVSGVRASPTRPLTFTDTYPPLVTTLVVAQCHVQTTFRLLPHCYTPPVRVTLGLSTFKHLKPGPGRPVSLYAAHTSTESPPRNHSPISRPPATYPTAHHQPYPQSRPHPQGLCVGRTPVRSQSRERGMKSLWQPRTLPAKNTIVGQLSRGLSTHPRMLCPKYYDLQASYPDPRTP